MATTGPKSWFFCLLRWVGEGDEGAWMSAPQAKYNGMPFKGGFGDFSDATGAPSPRWTVVQLDAAHAYLVGNDPDFAWLPNADMNKRICDIAPLVWSRFADPVTAAGVDLSIFPSTATLGDVLTYLVSFLTHTPFDWRTYS